MIFCVSLKISHTALSYNTNISSNTFFTSEERTISPKHLSFLFHVTNDLLFAVSVDTYNSEDWQKLKAAVNVLKNPVLDDTVMLESSAIGQFLHTDYVKSQSTPSITNLVEDEYFALQNGVKSSLSGYQPPGEMDGRGPGDGAKNRPRRFSESGILSPYRVQVLDTNQASGNHHYASSSDDLTNDWVASLPEYGRRMRSHTEPPVPLGSYTPGKTAKAKTLPIDASLRVEGSDGLVGGGDKRRKNSIPQLKIADSDSQMSPVRVGTSKRVSVQSSSTPSAVSDVRSTESVVQSPTSPMAPNSKLVKIYMSKVQKGIDPQMRYFQIIHPLK